MKKANSNFEKTVLINDVQPNLNNRLLTYSILAGAVIAGTSTVNASIVGTSDNTTLNSHNATYAIQFNGVTKFTVRIITAANDGGTLLPATASAGFVRVATNYVKELASGYVVSAGKLFANNNNARNFFSQVYPTQFVGNGDKYIGVKFKDTAGDNGVKYGWIKVNVAAGASSVNIISHAYEDNGGSITANGVLPVELTSFYSLVTLNSVKLKWETATEVNNYGFEVERKEIGESSKEIEWQKIGFVEGHGNSNSPKKYIFEDKTYAAGKVYKYRLKQIDFDGAFEHSDELVVETTVPGKAELAQNYPNPFNPSTTIKFSMPEADFAKLTVYNSIGQEVSVLINENLEPGFYTYLFDGGKLASGAYVYKLETAGRVITKKMLLIK